MQSFVLPSTTQDLELLQYSNPARSDTASSELFDRYPDMRTIAARERHLVLAHKIVADLMSNIILCTAVTIGVSLSTLPLLGGLANPNGLTIDPVARQLDWAESAIWRANLDGTDKQQLPHTDSSFIAGIHVVYP